MTQVQHLHVRMNIRDGFDLFLVTVKEVGPVSFPFVLLHRQPLVNLLNGIVGQRIFREVFDWFADQFSTIHKNPSLVAFDETSVIGVVSNNDFGSTGIFKTEKELSRGIVAVVFDGKSIFEFDRMFGSAANRQGTVHLSVLP